MMTMAGENRYSDSKKLVVTGSDGRQRTCFVVRLPPRPDQTATRGAAVVAPCDRPDLLATRTTGNPMLFWRLCDANGVTNPFSLTNEVGRSVHVPTGGTL